MFLVLMNGDCVCSVHRMKNDISTEEGTRAVLFTDYCLNFDAEGY